MNEVSGSDQKTGGDITAEIIERKVVYEGFSRFVIATVRQYRRDGREQVVDREFQHRGDAVAVLPYDPLRKVAILVRQLRVPLLARGDGSELLLEVPAGHLEHGEDPLQTARREVHEEAGLTLGEVTKIVEVFTSPGMNTEKLCLYLGRYGAADRVGDGGGLHHEGEDIEVVEWPLAQVADAISDGRISDAKTVILVQALMLREADLFRG